MMMQAWRIFFRRDLFCLPALLLALIGLCGSPAMANDALLDQHDAHTWLKKIQAAARKLNYSGTFVYQEASQMRTSRITHVMDGKNELQKLEMLDGKPREFTRNNEEITCYVPESKTILIEKRGTQEVFPAIFGLNDGSVDANYLVKKAGADRVAGFDCQVLQLEPKDNYRYGYKLWAEKNTGLLLRVQTLNERGEVVEQIAFSQLKIGDIERSRVKPSVGDTTGWRVEYASVTQVQLSNWLVKWVPPGFRKTREIKRMVSDGNAQREVSQIVFSDGLAAISVFIEGFQPQKVEGVMQQGAMNIVGRRQGDFWLTVVGEVPALAIRQVANSIEYKPK